MVNKHYRFISTLLNLLNKYFFMDEPDNFCFGHSIPFENLAGNTKNEKAQVLVRYLEQDDKLGPLCNLINEEQLNLIEQVARLKQDLSSKNKGD